MYSSSPMINVDSIHKALASSLRRDILRWLRTPSVYFPGADPLIPHGVSVGMIHARTGLSKSTVSAHLSTLQQAGLVTTKRLGQWVFLSRDEAVIRSFVASINNDL